MNARRRNSVNTGRACSWVAIALSWETALSVSPCRALAGQDDATIQVNSPGWLEEAYWYRVDVSSFRNAVPANPNSGSEGGDLSSLSSELAILESVGVNALWLSGVFSRDQTAEDSVRGFVKSARAEGFRVVVDVSNLLRGELKEARPDDEVLPWALVRHWADPDASEATADGVDGWVVGHCRDHQGAFRRLRARVKEANAHAVLICDPAGPGDQGCCGQGFDAVVARDVADAIDRFLAGGPNPLTAEGFSAELKRLFQTRDALRRRSSLLPLSRTRQDRSGASPGGQPASPDGDDSDAAQSRIRLAVALQYFLPAAPVIRLSEESGFAVGIEGDAAPSASRPDPSTVKTNPSTSRSDMIALLRMLKKLRDDLPPLRAGAFEVLPADDDRQLVTLARSLPGNRVILVMNYGDSRRTVTMRAGRAGQLIGVLNPHLKLEEPGHKRRRRRPVKRHPDGVPMLPVTGTRQFVNRRGEIRFRIAPRSIRIILINDKEPR